MHIERRISTIKKIFFSFFCFIYNIIHVEVKKPKINPEMAL